jgi:tRNA threonylcarbamoyladenosine biosynthesis protein TsaB
MAGVAVAVAKALLLSSTAMIVLALDTTTRTGSCAVARDGIVLREEASDSARPPAARLPADLMTLLAHADVQLAEVDVFAVAVGPGSFTGLRIGIATMQGLAFAAGKPLIGVSGFDALLSHAGAGRVAAWVDAWRGEVYAATYDDGRETEPPLVAPPSQLLRDIAATTTFIGDGAQTFRAEIATALGDRARFATPLTPLLAGAIATLATADAQRGHRPPPHAVRPLYVRRPDAELARDRA